MTSSERVRLRQALLDADRRRRGDDGGWKSWQRAATAYHLALRPEDARWLVAADVPVLRTLDEIRLRAAGLSDASQRLHGLSGRTTDLDSELEHSAAAGWFHEMLAAMYPASFWAALEAVREGDRSGLEPMLRFLEADPWCFRSGYVKAKIISALPRVTLSESEMERLRVVVLDFVDYPKPRRELRSYVNLARAAVNEGLRASLNERAQSANPVTRFNAQAVIGGLTSGHERESRRIFRMIDEMPGPEAHS